MYSATLNSHIQSTIKKSEKKLHLVVVEIEN